MSHMRRNSHAGRSDCGPRNQVQDATELLVGLTIDEAKLESERAGWTLRIVKRGNLPCVVTRDVDPKRVNVDVDFGCVLNVHSFG